MGDRVDGAHQVWLKASGPDTAFEVGLYELLHRVTPSRVLTPLATDTTRGWVLLPDGGIPLGERATGAGLAQALEAVLPQYGQLQRDLAPRVQEMLALGVADMRAAVLPERFVTAVKAVGGQIGRHGTAADQVAFRKVTGLHGTVSAWCAELDAAPGSASVDHNDLHPWNVLPGDGSAGVRFYDWGDAVVAHPFASALVALSYLQAHLEVDPHHPTILRVRDAYLEVFGDASHGDAPWVIVRCGTGSVISPAYGGASGQRRNRSAVRRRNGSSGSGTRKRTSGKWPQLAKVTVKLRWCTTSRRTSHKTSSSRFRSGRNG